jgi:hypothetical protein
MPASRQPVGIGDHQADLGADRGPAGGRGRGGQLSGRGHQDAPEVACTVPDELDEPLELEEPAELDEPADPVELDEPVEPEDEAEPLPDGLLLDDDLPAVPDVALEVAPEEWVDPGSVAATAPAAMTLAAPTPTVTADSRFMPRCRSADGGTDRPRWLLGIGSSFPWLDWPAPRWRRRAGLVPLRLRCQRLGC